MLLLLSLLVSALPPASDEDLERDAELIAVGTVTKLESKEVQVRDGTDRVYTATIAVTRVEKQVAPEGGKPQKLLTVRFRRTGKRPDGWTGAAGQNSVPEDGQRIRVFARNGVEGLTLLEPNGWELVAGNAENADAPKR